MRGGAPSRRRVLQLFAALPASSLLRALPATAVLGTACSTDEARPRYLTDTERRVLEACADAVFPPDDSGPGAAELGAVDFIENLLTALEHDPPLLHAAGPFSDRNPFPADDGSATSRFPPDQFLAFLPLSRVQRAGWQLRLYGSSGTPGGGPNDAALGPVIGLRDLLRDGIAAAITALGEPLDSNQPVPPAIYSYLPDAARAQVELLVVQSVFSLPEYGGNRDSGGWRTIHYEGDSMPFGYTYVEPGTGEIHDRPGAPVIGPADTPDPEPMDAQIVELFRLAALTLGGKQFY